MPATTESDPTTQLSTGDYHLWNLTNVKFENMRWNERVGLRYIYSEPGMPAASYVKNLTEWGFSDPDHMIIGPILNTNLVEKNFSGTIFPNTQPVIKQAIEYALKRAVL